MKMKTNKVLSSLIAVFAGIVLFAPSHALASAFGVSPPWIENENIKPGSNFVYVINLSANELPGDMIVTSVVEGDAEITKWLTIQNQDSLVMPKDKSIVPMSVNVNIPADAKLGKYTGNLKISLAPKESVGENVSVLLGSNISIKLNVISDDITDYWVQTITADPINEGQSVRLKMEVKNLGNTDISSIPTNVSIVDMKTGEKLASGSPDKLSVRIYPQTMGSAELSFSAPDLKMGNYWMDVDSFKDGKSTYKNRLYFTVNPSVINNSVSTAVQVGEVGAIKAAASSDDRSPKTDIRTSVTVRAPYTNTLIVVVIGLLLVLTGFVVKIYVSVKKRRR